MITGGYIRRLIFCVFDFLAFLKRKICLFGVLDPKPDIWFVCSPKIFFLCIVFTKKKSEIIAGPANFFLTNNINVVFFQKDHHQISNIWIFNVKEQAQLSRSIEGRVFWVLSSFLLHLQVMSRGLFVFGGLKSGPPTAFH